MTDMVPESFVRALDRFESVLAAVAPDRWDAPSPCAGWNATDVAGHVIGNLRAIEAYATGRDKEDSAVGPAFAVPEDADDLTRLLALLGRRDPGG